ncbi:MAG: tRNA-dihydrouridine synthase family protein [Myxococcales bacterium]|nr:tRNA-dihydrouridine synthase family protein [Myxococcales bacterium]
MPLAKSAAALPLDMPRSGAPFLSLAPMDGVTDAITRALLTDYAGGDSGISLCTSEFVRVTREPVPEKVLLRHCPELRQGGRTSAGVPVTVQLLGGDPAPMAESARRAAALGAPGIDLNFGCPAKTVNRHDGGATLLKFPGRLRAIVQAVRDLVPAERPVSVKLRTGWASSERMEEIALAAEAGGASWLTIHGRTRMDMYGPPADFGPIGRARAVVAIPVVANGDLSTPRQVDRCRAISGCEAYMIGRPAMARPWLFRQLRGHPPDGRAAYIALLLDFADRLIAAGTTDHRTLGRLKNWLSLSCRIEPAFRSLFDAVKREQHLPALLKVLVAAARDKGGNDPVSGRFEPVHGP